MTGPLDPPEGNWWDEQVNRRETMWLGIAGAWSLSIFGWMAQFTQTGDQNPTGETRDVEPEQYRKKVQTYKENAEDTEKGLVPPGEDVYIGAMRYNWDGLPAVIETGTEYKFHLGSYDVQHGFSIRPEETLSKQINLQVLPGDEWIVPMEFDEAGTYHVMCNEFCGQGHRTMHGVLHVVEG
jgi:cytochrome c oxidase subunit 2